MTAYTRAANGDLLGFRRNNARYYTLYDGLGSVAAVTDANGAVVNRYSYDPYGNTLSTSEQVTQPYRYAGAYLDTATNLYKMGARYYDPATGRFTQPLIDSTPPSIRVLGGAVLALATSGLALNVLGADARCLAVLAAGEIGVGGGVLG